MTMIREIASRELVMLARDVAKMGLNIHVYRLGVGFKDCLGLRLC